MISWETITQHISSQTHSAFSLVSRRAVGGGCINDAWQLIGESQTYFVKCNHADKLTMFEAEAAGLSDIAMANVIKVPKPICWGIAGQRAYIVLEYIDFGSGSGSVSCDAEFGRQLAAMHQITQPQYGWRGENTIGSTRQINQLDSSWLSFWRDNRLGFQLRLAAQNGFGSQLQRKGEKLQENLHVFFKSTLPDASLLHGDLWSGNYAFDAQGRPVIFDPAVYYGDRETDIAMTELFGGFSQQFYQAYNEILPLDDGYKVRKILYNLYHILNHLNLFGSGYLLQSESMMDRLLGEV